MTGMRCELPGVCRGPVTPSGARILFAVFRNTAQVNVQVKNVRFGLCGRAVFRGLTDCTPHCGVPGVLRRKSTLRRLWGLRNRLCAELTST